MYRCMGVVLNGVGPVGIGIVTIFIYSPLNKLSDLWFILTQQSMGEMSMVNPVTRLFSLFEALNGAFNDHLFRASF